MVQIPKPDDWGVIPEVPGPRRPGHEPLVAAVAFQETHQVALRVGEHRDGYLGRDVGNRHHNRAAGARDLVQAGLRVRYFDIDRDALALAGHFGADAAAYAVPLVVKHAVVAHVDHGVAQLPAENVLVEAMQGASIAAHDLEPGDRTRHFNSSR